MSEPPAPTVWHSFRCRDSRAEIEFLTEALGFVVAAVYEDGGRVGHAQLDWPEGGGVMVTTRPDTVHARAVAAGAEMGS